MQPSVPPPVHVCIANHSDMSAADMFTRCDLAGTGAGAGAGAVSRALGRPEVVEVAVLDAAEERCHLGLGVDQRGAARVARVADGNRAVGQFGHLYAAPVRVAVTALLPVG